ncbi:hypothetical protein NDU88_005323 [Pleurodeles waltl]|uniref:Uncharacterized protein n=1 Tax=Pleurodeles waltl TaxID=8319 RepID=A0AAV7RNH7_PLEWA|nr:hypothetical protein NDU88_005323 [Pleurodeles waltl]
MTGVRGGKAVQPNKLDRYTLPREASGAEVFSYLEVVAQTWLCLRQGPLYSKTSWRTSKEFIPPLEAIIDSVTLEVSLLRANLRNMGTRMREVEDRLPPGRHELLKDPGQRATYPQY